MTTNGILLFLAHAYPALFAGICSRNKRFGTQIKKALKSQNPQEFSEAILKTNFPMAFVGLNHLGHQLGKAPFDLETNEAYWLCYSSSKVEKIREMSHNFMVFRQCRIAWNIIPKERKDDSLAQLNGCLIMPGRITRIIRKPQQHKPGLAVIVRDPIIQKDSGIVRSNVPVSETFKFWERDLKVSDFVSLHYGWICSGISEEQFKELMYWNGVYISRFNFHRLS